MIIDYDNFILARPGYNEKYNREVSWEELKKTFLLYKRIPMIVAGGSHMGAIDPNNAIGFIDAKIDEAEQIIRGEPVFYNEKFEDIPPEIQQMLAHKKLVPASLGYERFNTMCKMDHVAIGVKSPVFEDVGFNAESNFHYEETEGINNEEAEPEQKAPEPPKLITFTEEQFEKLMSRIGSPPVEAPTQTPAEAVTAEKEEEPEEIEAPPPAEEQPVSQPKPLVEPERVIKKEPTKTPSTTTDGLFEIPEGTKIISTPIGKPKEK